MEKKYKWNEIIGKIVKNISFPEELELTRNKGTDVEYTTKCYDRNIVIEFNDGTILKLASWDYEGYSSGIYEEIVTVDNSIDK